MRFLRTTLIVKDHPPSPSSSTHAGIEVSDQGGVWPSARGYVKLIFAPRLPIGPLRVRRLRRVAIQGIPLRKEVIQPQVLLRLPCYDLVPITELAVDASLLDGWVGGFGHSRLSWLDGRCVQGSGTYSPLRS